MTKSEVDKAAREAAWEKVESWLQAELAAFHTPRLSDIVQVGLDHGLSSRQTRLRVRRDFPSYQSTGSPKYPWPAKRTRNHVLGFYGTCAIDVAFFGKSSPELRSLGVHNREGSPVLVMIDVATRFAMAEPLGRAGKSAQGLLKATKALFARYRARYGTAPFVLLSDKERGVMSGVMAEYLESTGTKLFTYAFSRTKSLFAEGLIRLLRNSVSKLSKRFPEKRLSWVDTLQSILEGYNGRKIVLHGKKMSFAPRDLTPDNFYKYEQEIQTKIPQYSLLSFSIHPSLFKWRLPIGERVRLTKRAVSVPGIGSKWSENPLDPVVWVVRRRVVHLNVKNQLVKTVWLEEESPPGGAPPRHTQQPEAACVSLGIKARPLDALEAES